MSVEIKEIKEFEITETRFRWLNDDDIERYIGFSDGIHIGDVQKIDSKNERHFEIYNNNEHVGDIRFKYNSESDRKNKSAEFFIIIGVRNAGMGSRVFPKAISAASNYFKQIYCFVHKSNIRSAKLMKKNGFYVDELTKNDILFKLDLEHE